MDAVLSERVVTVNFRGADLYGFERDDGVFVALKPIVEAMGMSWSGQHDRVRRDPILNEGIRVMRIPFGAGGSQEVTCLRLDLVNGWLFTIDAGRIKDGDVRERVILYQRECYRVLHEHFTQAARPAPASIPIGEDLHEPEGSRLRLVTEARQTFGQRVAGELWFKLGLPVTPSMTERARQLELIDFSRIRTGQDGNSA